jgi:hypothetical protein
MPLFQPRTKRPSNRLRRGTPSCRGGASSLLRLAQPVSARKGPPENRVRTWLARAASVLSPAEPAPVMMVRPSEFAPSQWLVGH